MSEIQATEQLLAEVGPLFEEIEQIERLTEDAWLVVFDDETAIEVACDPTGRKLSFTMSLGSVPPERQAEMYQAMLTYSFLKQDTGGFHFGTDGDNGNAHLMLDVCHLELTPAELAGILATVLETGETWQDVLHGDPIAEEASETEDDEKPSSGQIQV